MERKLCDVHFSFLKLYFVLHFQKIQQDMGYNNLANFHIIKKIGRGQFSEVYQAAYILDHTPVALKKVQVRTVFIS